MRQLPQAVMLYNNHSAHTTILPFCNPAIRTAQKSSLISKPQAPTIISMSATQNTDAVKANSNQTGEFSSKVPGHQVPAEAHGVSDDPLNMRLDLRRMSVTDEQHQVGRQVGNNAIPEHHIETLPAGSAPASNTFAPQTQGDVPGQTFNSASGVDGGAGQTSASDTLVGATSGQVNTGYGHPGQGQSSKELHDNTKQSGGLQNVGAAHAKTSDGPREGYGEQTGINRPAREDKQA